MIRITDMGSIASVMDFGVELFAWDWSNNYKSLATHPLARILQGFGLSIELPHVGLRNYCIQKRW
jgi:hypothetical protein